MSQKEKEEVIYDSQGPSGNIFAILGKIRDILRKQNRIAEYNELWKKVNHSQSYEEAMNYIGEVVSLVDVNRKKDMEME